MRYKELVEYLNGKNIHKTFYSVSWEDRLTGQDTVYFSKSVNHIINKRIILELSLLGFVVLCNK